MPMEARTGNNIKKKGGVRALLKPKATTEHIAADRLFQSPVQPTRLLIYL